MNFCTNLADKRKTNYVCASWFDFHYTQFLRYLFYVADITVFDNIERIEDPVLPQPKSRFPFLLSEIPDIS